MSASKHPVRPAAVDLLNAVLIDRRQLSDLTDGRLLARLEPADRARAQRLATDTLRGLERADRLLDRFMRKRPPLPVRNALRLGTVELCLGGDAHGVVNGVVNLIGRNPRHKNYKPMANAVLRKVAEEGVGPWKDLRIPKLPDWLRTPLKMAWGSQAITAIEKAHFEGAPLDVTLRTPSEDWAKKLNGTWLPTGSLRLEKPGQVSTLPGYESGDWWIQDAAAALPAKLLAAKPGENVLDLCAAPGGKTMQLASAGAKVTALDLSERRMNRVSENLARTQLSAKLVTADALSFQSDPFDAILLDAPCSATGTIRRHPDLPHAKDGSEFGALIALQEKLIDKALTLLKPGGRLVFCTCSLLPDEGEVQVEEAIARHPEVSTDRDALNTPGLDPNWITEEGGLRLRPDYWPELGGMDGFYMAVLRKAT